MAIYFIEYIEKCLKRLIDEISETDMSWLKQDKELYDDFIYAISIMKMLESASHIHYLTQLQYNDYGQTGLIRYGPNGLIVCFTKVEDGIVITYIGKEYKKQIQYGCGEYIYNESNPPWGYTSGRTKDTQNNTERICNIDRPSSIAS